MERTLPSMMALVGLALVGLALAPVLNGLADNLPRHNPLGKGGFSWDLFLPRCRWCGQPRRGLMVWGLLVGLGGGRGCRGCGGTASWRDVGVELALALLMPMLWVGGRHEAFLLIEGAGAVFLFVLIIVVDLEQRLVLMEVVLSGALWFVVASAFRGSLVSSAAGLVVGTAVFLVLFLFGVLFARAVGSGSAVALGLGDVSLAALVGLAVGWPAVLSTLLLAILLAGLAGAAILLWHLAGRRPLVGLTMAYGPYLAVAALGIILFGSGLFPPGLIPR
jgi:prepilin signal peptidase PulO-like enzyme (type II secretory pathway)